MFIAENRKKIAIMKNCVIHRSLVFDDLALGNYIVNNRAKSTIETLKEGLEFVQW